MTVLDTGCDSVFGISRTYRDETLILLFNFSEDDVSISLDSGTATDLIFNGAVDLSALSIRGYGAYWLLEHRLNL